MAGLRGFTAVLGALALMAHPGATGAQERNVALAQAEATAGSGPYAEAVRNFLERRVPKIVGGEEAPEGAFPWQVSLGVSWIGDPYFAHFCGGSVYSGSWIVTAAHCVERTAPKDVMVTAGTHDLQGGGVRRNAKRIIVHARYAPGTMDNDVALVELMDPLPLGTAIRAIPIAGPNDEKALLQKETPLTVTGWGATNQGGTAVRDLRFVDVRYVERDDCNRPLAYDGRVTENMLCAGVSAGGKDSCQGDSGGPLASGTGPGATLLGAVSWGEGCARAGKFGIYARLSRYADWIAACVAEPVRCR